MAQPQHQYPQLVLAVAVVLETVLAREQVGLVLVAKAIK